MKTKVRCFTLIELLVVIGIISLLSGIAFTSYQNAIVQGGRVQSSSKLTNIVDTILANETTYSKSGFSSTYAKPLGIRTVLPSEMSEGNIMISDNLIFSNDRNYTVFRDLAGEHPFDAEHGYYMFSAVDGGGNIKKRLDSKVRIAMEVYDWTNEGDGKTAVAFADGHIEVLNVTTPHGELDIIEVLSTLGNGDGQL